MKYAIIAAGEGSRLSQEGLQTPKPLVQVAGECLVDRLVRIFLNQGAAEVLVICNKLTPLVSDHLAACRQKGLPVRFIAKTTPSSMHSMSELAPLLDGVEPFVLTTVDTIFREEEFARYVETFRALLAAGKADGLMGVTDYIDDEKPLYVKTADQQDITAFLDSDSQPHYVSAGIYGLTPRVLPILRACIEKGESRMRNFQRALLASGQRLKAYPFSTVLDIDHASDIAKAEKFLRP